MSDTKTERNKTLLKVFQESGTNAAKLFCLKLRLDFDAYFEQCAKKKNRQISIKVAQNDLTRKMIDFDSFTKFA